jgi:hypothetical protein
MIYLVHMAGLKIYLYAVGMQPARRDSQAGCSIYCAYLSWSPFINDLSSNWVNCEAQIFCVVS